MKKIIFTLMFSYIAAVVYGDGGSIKWDVEYDNSIVRAQREDKPLLLFFSSPEQSEWDEKLSKEVFDDPQFIATVSDRFIFVRVDFPEGKGASIAELSKKKCVRDMYKVSSFPTVVVADKKGRQICVMGYRAGGGEEYSRVLMQNLKEYMAMDALAGCIEQGNVPTVELEKLYNKAKNLGIDEYAAAFMREGLKRADNAFFMIEEYRQRVAEGGSHDPETRALRRILDEGTYDERYKVPYNLAVIDFQAQLMGGGDHQKALEPLLAYLERVGESDKENSWRIAMTIAEVFNNNSSIESALYYARSGYESAPDEMKDSIADAIRSLERSSGAESEKVL